MKKEVFYDKKTIILFISIIFIFLAITFVQNSYLIGGGQLGIPFSFGFWWDDYPEVAAGTEYNFFYLFLDLMIYYFLALVISNLLEFMKK